MNDPRRSKWDDFSTIGSGTEARRNATIGPRLWALVAIGCMMLGGIAGGGAYVAYEFWIGTPPDPHRRHSLKRRLYEKRVENPITEEQLWGRTRNFALGGVALGALATGGMFAASRLRGND